MTRRHSEKRHSALKNAPNDQRHQPDEQRPLNFNPLTLTPAESERLRRELAFWDEQEALEEFRPLPGETMQEFYAAREIYRHDRATFGPLFPQPPREPCQAWQMVQGKENGPAVKTKRPVQLTLPFDY